MTLTHPRQKSESQNAHTKERERKKEKKALELCAMLRPTQNKGQAHSKTCIYVRNKGSLK